MGNGEGGVLDPFPDGVLAILHVTGRFGSRVVAPLEARLIVIVERSGQQDIRDRVVVRVKYLDEFSAGNGEFVRFIG